MTTDPLHKYSPLAGGYLTGKYRNGAIGGRRATVPFPPVDDARGTVVLSVMDGVAEAHGTTREAVALAWLRQQKGVSSTIVGVKGVDQLEANLASLDVTLTAAEMTVLDEAGGLMPEYPGWMLTQSSAARAGLLRTGEVPAVH